MTDLTNAIQETFNLLYLNLEILVYAHTSHLAFS